MTDLGDLRRASLEAAIDADPYDRQAYAVLADYLIEIGDPRGDLIAVQLKSRTGGMEHAAGEALAAMGDAGRAPPGVTFHWALGYARTAIIEPGTAKGVKDAFAHPSGRFIAELRVGHNTAPLAGSIAAIAAAPRPTLRILKLGKAQTHGDRAGQQREIGELSKLWAAVPRLQDLDVIGTGARFGDIVAPELRAFRFETPSLTVDEAEAIAKAHWPAIQRLDLHCGTAISTPAAQARRWLGGLLARDDMPALTELVLQHTTETDKLIGILAASKLLAKLGTLDLSHGDLSDAGVQTIADARKQFAHLTAFDLGFNKLSPDGVQRIQNIFPVAKVARQRSLTTYDNDDDDEYYDDVDE